MTEMRDYKLTRAQVVEICEALEFQADALDRRDGSRADITAWASKAASLWLLIDKFRFETPDLIGGLVKVPAYDKESALSEKSAETAVTRTPGRTFNAAGRNFLPACFVVLWTCVWLLTMTHQTIGANFITGVLGGLLSLWIGTQASRWFKARSPVWASRAGKVFYWFFIVLALLGAGLSAHAAYVGELGLFRIGLLVAALYIVIGVAALRALRRDMPAN
jgi:hypothetical protein